MIPNRHLKVGFFYLTLVFSASVVAYVMVISIAPNSIVVNYNVYGRKNINALAPQGWAFFSKDVHKDYFNVYTVDKILELKEIRSASTSQIFGLKRNNRMIHHKLNTIINNINPGLWYKFKGNPANIGKDNLSQVSISVNEPQLQGNYLIERGEPLPYEWFLSENKVYKTMEYVLLKVKPLKHDKSL